VKKLGITTAVAIAATLALTGAQGGCGNTKTVAGATEESVTCNEQPYSYTQKAIDKGGSGITVSSGLVRGALWVNCTPPGPDTYTITVTLLRNGLPYGKGAVYSGRPNAVGYEAYVFQTCKPGVYRLQYRYRWTLQTGVQQDTTTVPVNETLVQHDCDA
jgi:hypothetical protein